MISRPLLLLIALFSVQNSRGFTPLSSSRQWKGGERRSSQSRSTLFDTEESTLWTTQEWTATDFSGSLNSFEKTKISSIDSIFVPPDADVQGAETVPGANSFIGTDNYNSPASQLSVNEAEYPGKKKLRANVRETGTDSMKNYIKTMCNHELLNKNEEIILAREIQILLKWEDQREQLELQLLR